MWAAVLATALCMLASVALHLAVLRGLWRIGRARLHWLRGLGIAAMVIVCLGAHIAEIAIFALGMFIGAVLDGEIALALDWRQGHLDLWYYSAAFYTSLGAERPSDPGVRLFVACETLTGLILITWTASFLFLLMQQAWGQESPDHEA
jgi:hypothetical protein